MKLALTVLCENPLKRTGLTTMFREFIGHSLRLDPGLEWVVFAGPKQDLGVDDPRIQYVRNFPANDRLRPRLLADHFLVSPRAQALGARALLTVGFVPLRSRLPAIMHVNALQHLSLANRIGGLREFYRSWMVKRGVAKARLIITNSNFASRQLLLAFPECRGKLAMSYEGTQPQYRPEKAADEARALQARFKLEPGYLLWVSNFYQYKQAPLLLEGYAALPENVRRQMPLVMVGGDWQGGLREANAAAQATGISPDVRFLGWVEEEWLAPLYRHAVAYCLPSREETFGRTVTEAMSCGTPCLLNDIPIMHEVTEDHALLIDFADRDLVTQSLRRLFEDAALRQRLRAEGLAQAVKFSFEKLTRERIDAIRTALSRPERKHD